MDTRWTFDGIDDASRGRCEGYWEDKKARRVERLLARLPRPHRLSLGFESVGKGGHEFRGRALLALPTGRLVVNARAESLPELVDGVADKLVHRLQHHRDRLRAQWVDRRRARRIEEAQEVHELLAADHAAERRDSFYELLKPLLRPLERTIRVELDHLVKGGSLGARQLSVNDVRDEVLVRSWDGFPTRPDEQALDLWLHALVERVLAEFAEEPGRVALPDAEPPPREAEEGLEESDEAWAQVIEEHDAPDLEDLLPAAESTTGTGEIEADELREEIERTLRTKLAPTQRRALQAWLFEGLDAREIASVQGRPEVDVAGDIEEARALLRDRLAGQGA